MIDMIEDMFASFVEFVVGGVGFLAIFFVAIALLGLALMLLLTVL